MRGYFFTSKVGRTLCASCVLRDQRMLCAKRALVKAGWWRFTQPRAAEATANVAVVEKMLSIPRAGAICRRIIHATDGQV